MSGRGAVSTAAPDLDVIVIGGGQAGLPLVQALAKAGKTVALAERRNLGGSCVNFGCTPTKAAIASARAAHQARRGAAFGLRIPVVEVDFAAVLDRARSLVTQTRGHLLRGFPPAGGNPRLLGGHARLAGREGSAFRVEVGGETLTAGQVVLDTGTRTRFPRIDGLGDVDPHHAGNWLDRPELPEHIVVLGAGYIGLEMAQLYRRMGSRVTVLERSARILKDEDPDVSAALRAILESEGIQMRLDTKVTCVSRRGQGIRVTTRSKSSPGTLLATHLFVATGRRPNTGDLGLASVGLRLPPSGVVPVDARLSTEVRGLWAAGDIRGGAMFTHTAWDDFRVLVSQLLGDGSRTTQRITPYAIFTDPELGRVGLTERQARRVSGSLRVAKFEMRANGKARERGETRGFIKVLVDGPSDRILGAAVLSVDGSELVHLFVELMNAHAPASVLRDAVHIHPTLAEAVQSAVPARDAGR